MNTVIKDLKELEGKTIEHVLHDEDNSFTVRTTDGVDYDVVACGNSDNSGVYATLSFERLANDADWTEEDTQQAEKEGWSIFYCDGSKDGLYQIQRIDEMNMYSDDRAVWAKLVLSDEPLHKKAIHYIRKVNPKEYSKILGVYNDAEKYKKGIDQLVEHLKNASSFWENHSDEFYGSLDYDKIKHDTLWFCLSNDALTPTDEEVATHAYNLMDIEHSKQEAEFKTKQNGTD